MARSKLLSVAFGDQTRCLLVGFLLLGFLLVGFLLLGFPILIAYHEQRKFIPSTTFPVSIVMHHLVSPARFKFVTFKPMAQWTCIV